MAKALAEFLPLSVQLLPPKHLPMQTYHVQREQNHSTRLLEYLLDDGDLEPFQILGITAADLYIPIFTFVFGEAQLDGRAAIISIFRPSGGAGGSLPSKAVFLGRLLKLSLHELGHSFGVGHCQQPGCLMGFSANLEKLDLKPLAFCQYCQILLKDYFDRFDGNRPEV
ncbi:MAG: peptidase M54 [Deltaproteobacteria bacterium]|nr:peptidase M54 [Deltaproteobacteria bacterium]